LAGKVALGAAVMPAALGMAVGSTGTATLDDDGATVVPVFVGGLMDGIAD